MALRILLYTGKEVAGYALPVKTVLAKSIQRALPVGVSAPRNFSLTSQTNVKKIIVEESDDMTVVRGEHFESPFTSKVLKTGKEKEHACPLCALNLDIKHTDVLILSQFLRPDGCLLPRRVTGICNKQQLRIKYLVAMSQKAGLMPNLAPANSKKDPKKRYGSKRFNRYFDESTLD